MESHKDQWEVPWRLLVFEMIGTGLLFLGVFLS
jgi:hypothetical protein